jgi:hypothetical protein
MIAEVAEISNADPKRSYPQQLKLLSKIMPCADAMPRGLHERRRVR